MMKSSYTDKNGNSINFGDVLKSVKKLSDDSEFAPKEPFFKIELFDNKPMMYVSGMDEYHEIEGWQGADDEPNTLKHFEIVERQAQVFCLTFDEIIKLHEETQKVIKNNDYGFAPVMMIKISPDVEWEEKEYISTICLHEITKATREKDKEVELPWVDITDENKFDFI